MFSRDELLASLPVVLESPRTPLTVVAFAQYDFNNPSSEQELLISRGQRADFDSALHFWIKAIQAQGWEGRNEYLLPYLQSGKCRPITEAEFDALVRSHSVDLKEALLLPLRAGGEFVGALQMYDGWDDVAAIAEFEEGYVAFHWDTTA